MLRDRKLLGIVTMARSFNREVVMKFYANLKYDISVVNSPCFHKVTIWSHEFDFSPKVICDFLNCFVVKSIKKKEIDIVLDMNKVIVELTAFSMSD